MHVAGMTVSPRIHSAKIVRASVKTTGDTHYQSHQAEAESLITLHGLPEQLAIPGTIAPIMPIAGYSATARR
jgi:hypothetical protein